MKSPIRLHSQCSGVQHRHTQGALLQVIGLCPSCIQITMGPTAYVRLWFCRYFTAQCVPTGGNSNLDSLSCQHKGKLRYKSEDSCLSQPKVQFCMFRRSSPEMTQDLKSERKEGGEKRGREAEGKEKGKHRKKKGGILSRCLNTLCPET